MSEKRIGLDGLDAKKLLKTLEKRVTLCPSCERKLKLAGSLYLFYNEAEDLKVYYVICRKCEYNKVKQTNDIREQKRLEIEERLRNNMTPYSCEVVDDPNIDRILKKTVPVKKNLKIKAFEMTTFAWHVHDAKFFKENPERKFYARPIFDGEIEEAIKDNRSLKREAIMSPPEFTIVHEIRPKQRIYSYLSNLRGHPFEDDAFVAALFMVKVNPLLSSSDIYDMYKQIKENGNVVKDLDLSNLNNHNH